MDLKKQPRFEDGTQNERLTSKVSGQVAMKCGQMAECAAKNGLEEQLVTVNELPVRLKNPESDFSVQNLAPSIQPPDQKFMGRIAKILDDILNHSDVSIDSIVDLYFSSNYRQRTNGRWDDREEFVRHLMKLREVIKSAEITVFDELVSGNLYADRHQVRVLKRDGSITVQEVYLFGELDTQGRFIRIEETTLLIKGSQHDKNIGNMK